MSKQTNRRSEYITTPPWHLSPSRCRGKEGETEDEILREKEWMQETKTGRPQAGGSVLILKKVRENTLLLYYRLVLVDYFRKDILSLRMTRL